MFDIGFSEILVCAIVALLVLGPERLPGTVRTIGRWVGRARHTVNQFTDQIDREIRAEDMKKRIEEQMKKAGVEKSVMDDVTRQVNDALRTPLPLVGADHLRESGNTIAPPKAESSLPPAVQAPARDAAPVPVPGDAAPTATATPPPVAPDRTA